jgi:hypothetical protein
MARGTSFRDENQIREAITVIECYYCKQEIKDGEPRKTTSEVFHAECFEEFICVVGFVPDRIKRIIKARELGRQ